MRLGPPPQHSGVGRCTPMYHTAYATLCEVTVEAPRAVVVLVIVIQCESAHPPATLISRRVGARSSALPQLQAPSRHRPHGALAAGSGGLPRSRPVQPRPGARRDPISTGFLSGMPMGRPRRHGSPRRLIGRPVRLGRPHEMATLKGGLAAACTPVVIFWRILWSRHRRMMSEPPGTDRTDLLGAMRSFG